MFGYCLFHFISAKAYPSLARFCGMGEGAARTFSLGLGLLRVGPRVYFSQLNKIFYSYFNQ